MRVRERESERGEKKRRERQEEVREGGEGGGRRKGGERILAHRILELQARLLDHQK